jgi:hypothetical protein
MRSIYHYAHLFGLNDFELSQRTFAHLHLTAYEFPNMGGAIDSLKKGIH